MKTLDDDDGRIARSGRTLAQHLEIVSSLETDPRGDGTVTLDFESGDFSGWSVRRLARPYSAVIQNEVVRVGTKACRFEIRKGDEVSQGLRAELRDWFNAPFDTDIWYGFSTFIPAGFKPPRGVGVVLAQWHDQAEIGDPSGKPPLAIRYLDGRLRFTGAFAEVASHDPEMRYEFHTIDAIPHDQWLDFAFRIRWGREGESEIEAFLDGRDLFQFSGPLGYRNQQRGPYFKFGVYASGEIVDPLIAYHDNYSRAGSLEAVDPSVQHTFPAAR
ncbi:MAG: polysaccharide lyase [Alphaproteobacteria bacterium]|nr:polysaccharide lyase [Alphaproteobacteria bacterium]